MSGRKRRGGAPAESAKKPKVQVKIDALFAMQRTTSSSAIPSSSKTHSDAKDSKDDTSELHPDSAHASDLPPVTSGHDLTPAQVAAMKAFREITQEDSAVAVSCLRRENWVIGIAVNNYYFDKTFLTGDPMATYDDHVTLDAPNSIRSESVKPDPANFLLATMSTHSTSLT
jgi:hypothetical protein